MSQNTIAIATFQLYFTPLLCLTGLTGNSFTVFIFCNTKMNKVSSSYYLAALAVNDNMFLVSLFLVWLEALGWDLFNRPGLCQSMVYLAGICSFLNIWLVVAFTLERYIAVKYPFLRTTLCTTRRAKIAVAVLTAISILAQSPLLVFSNTVVMEDNATVCTINEEWTSAATIFNYVDFATTFLLPVAMVVFLNVSIGKTLIRVSVARKMLTNERQKICALKYQISRNNVTKMLLVVSTVFLCLNFPSYVMRILTYLLQFELMEIEDIEKFSIIQQWCLQLFYTNFGINFFLYCISGQNFRRALVGIFSKTPKTGTETLILSDSRTTPTHSSSRCKRKGTVCVHVTVKASPKQSRQMVEV
ncbi:unnamed protein product [Phaedon cochleariae]|uniref:G-protein coupled receptors family 1 profile domain-containing protein n=1 Tax=Phaedon cochleariae TaxID=80249 RepID=A0A9P0DRI4_PHACE|nr:unnamed protein product [Phaedon cochleariae]